MTAALQAVTFSQDPLRAVSWVLHGHGLTHYDSARCRWVHQKTTGWRGTSPPRTDRTARASASGSYAGEAFRDERIITLTGTCRAPSRAVRADAEDRLGQLLPDGVGLVVLRRVGENGLPQVRYVELDDVIDPIPVSRTWFDWAITLAAPDPRKFTPTWASTSTDTPILGSGGVVATGSGAVSTAPGLAAGVSPRQALATAAAAGTVPNPIVLELVGPVGPGGANIVEISGGGVVRWRGPLGPATSAFINLDSHPAHDVPGADDSIPGYGALVGPHAARNSVGFTGGRPRLLPGRTCGFLLGGDIDTTTRLRVHQRGAWD